MCGGAMYQHVEKHLGNHMLIDVESKLQFIGSSTHHQMMRPRGSFTILAYAKMGGKRESMSSGTAIIHIATDAVVDPEVVYYPSFKALCFQPHPEFRAPEYAEMRKYFFTYISNCFKLN